MAGLFAQNRKLSAGKIGAIMNESVLTSQPQNDNQITIRFDLNELELVEVETGYGKAFIATLEISYGKYVDFENIEIAPSKGNLSRIY